MALTHVSSLSLSLSLSALSESVKVCGAEALALLGQMKQQDSLAAADDSKLRAALEAILATAEVCTPHTHILMFVLIVIKACLNLALILT